MQGVSQELFRACPERIEIPPSLQDLGKLGKLNIVLLALLRFEYI